MKGKKWLFRPISFFLIVSLLVPALIVSCGDEDSGATLAPGEVIELKFANYIPAPATHSVLLGEFCLELEERTGGRVKVDYFPGGTLLTAEAMFDGVIDGIADIGFSHVYYTPGRMPVTECAGLPIGYASAWVSGQVVNDFYDEFQPDEWDAVKVLWLSTSTPSAISTADTQIRTLEDLQGLTIRAPGLSGEVISALGGTPAPTPMMEVYDAIARGEIDGEQSNFETLKNFNFADVVNYTTSIWQINFPYPFYVVMNKDTYNKLPDDIKVIFDKLVGEYKERFVLMWNSIDFVGKAHAEGLGVEFYTLPDAEAAKWQAAVESVIDNYITKMVDAGHSQAEVESWVEFLRERAEYWTAKQIAWHIISAAGPPEVTQ